MRIGKTTGLMLLLSLPVLALAGNGPRISFDKVTHDYGKVMYGNTVNEEFTFTNTGDETLKIENLRSSCGCTKAVQGSSEVPAKQKSKITASFDTTGLSPGRKQKNLFVQTNDPVNPEVKLTIFADVIREVTVSPPTLAKKLTGPAEEVKFSLKFANTSDKQVSVTGLQAKGTVSGAKLEPQPLVLDPRGSATAELSMRIEKKSDQHYYMGKLVLLTDHPREKEIDLRYLIQVEEAK
ncbi:MAG: DUF1573 domain-containing protein [Desulfomonile tiedjei]|nr:DUF1573 domain-containing protein [Desulfomonile tiedjei]